jgi:hypothetical protein
MFSATTGLSKEPSSLIKMDEPEEQVNTRPAPKLLPLDNYLALNIQKQLNRAETNKAVDIRPPSIAFLTVNSADRYNPVWARYNNPANGAPYTLTNPADFSINLPQSVMNGYFTRIAVQQIVFNLTYPFICQRTNGFYINWQPGGTGAVTRYFVSLPVTSYGSFSLAINYPVIQTAIRTATGSATFTVVSTANQSFLTFASGNTDKFYLSRWTSTYDPNSITLYDIFGMPTTQILSTTQYGTPFYTYFVTPYIDVVCEQITGNQQLRDGSTSSTVSRTLLQRVYLGTTQNFSGNGNFQSNGIYFSQLYPTPKWISWPANQPIGGSLRFQLLDAQGLVLSCGASTSDANGNLLAYNDVNMGDWSMVLQFTEQ